MLKLALAALGHLFSPQKSRAIPPTPILNPTMMSIQVYGIPNCGTCKKARQWLEDNSIEYEFLNTKENPPTPAQIASWVAALGNKPMRNTSGKSYRNLPEEKKRWTDEQWIAAFAEDAMLLKRPLFVREGTAVLVGFRAKEEVIRDRLAGR